MAKGRAVGRAKAKPAKPVKGKVLPPALRALAAKAAQQAPQTDETFVLDESILDEGRLG